MDEVFEIRTLSGLRLRKEPQDAKAESYKYLVGDKEVEFWFYSLLPQSCLEALRVRLKPINLTATLPDDDFQLYQSGLNWI